MTHSQVIAKSVLPQVPNGLEVRTRSLHGPSGHQEMTAGGFFTLGAKRHGASGMAAKDVTKVAAFTVDVDVYNWNDARAIARWGPDAEGLKVNAIRKAAMRDASEDEVKDWFAEIGMVEIAQAAAAEVGLPAKANRVLYTGQGLCLIYWCEDDFGWVDSEWSPKDMLSAVTRLYNGMKAEGTAPWWWDAAAKDVGTRIFPLPGSKHRDTGKTVCVLTGHDEITPLRPWFDAIDEKYPKEIVVKENGRTKRIKVKDTDWEKVDFDPAEHPYLNDGESGSKKGIACPTCGGSGYKRQCEEHISCYSCHTQFVFRTTATPSGPLPTVTSFLALTDQGHAKWPQSIPSHVVNAARTGSGKTELMSRERDAWMPKNIFPTHKRVIAIAPTILLANNLANRLNINHLAATTSHLRPTDSFSTCFAGLHTKIKFASGQVMTGTYVMVDEVEAVLSQLNGMLKPKDGVHTYNMLIGLVARAARVMLCDAHAGPATTQFLLDVNAFRQAENLPPIVWDRWETVPHTHTFEYIPAVKDGSRTLSSNHLHKGRIHQAIADGKKLAIYVPSRDEALGFTHTLRKSFPTKDIRVIVRAEASDQPNDCSEAALTADVLVYNNAMGSGVSYDLVGHYDEVHLIMGRGAISDAHSVEQALHRIRHPNSKTYVISGVESKPITGQRCNPQYHLRLGVQRLERGQAALDMLSNDKINMIGTELCSNEALRLAKQQATIIASRFEHGFRWVLSYLGQHHKFIAGFGEQNDAFVEEIQDERSKLVRKEAIEIAKAQPLTDEQADVVRRRGTADTLAERYSYRAYQMTSAYGTAYSGVSVGERADLVIEAKKGLLEKAKFFAGTMILLNGQAAEKKKLQRTEARGNAKQTVVTAKFTVGDMMVFAGLLGYIAKHGLDDGIRFEVPSNVAADAFAAQRRLMKKVGFVSREDTKANPIRALGALLKRAGLGWRVEKRGPKGAQTRHYFLYKADVARMNLLSTVQRERWLYEPDVMTVESDDDDGTLATA